MESPNQEELKEAHFKTHHIKMAKLQDKERILKAAREKQEVIHKGAPIRLATEFSVEMLPARRERQEIF